VHDAIELTNGLLAAVEYVALMLRCFVLDHERGRAPWPPALIDFASERQWVGWRNEERGGKPTKVPYVAAGRQAEADDPTTWLTHDSAAAVAEDMSVEWAGGVGIELGRCGDV
jgi:hypothetical protein